MNTWDLHATYELVSRQFGKRQMLLAKESARSLVDRQNYASYHYREVLRLTKAFERRYIKDGMLLDIYTQEGVNMRAAFEVAVVKMSAHALAAIQSIHALPDILAHVAYFSTGLNLGASAIDDRSVNVQSVAAALKSDGRYENLGQLLNSSQQGSNWTYVANLVNLSKHRSVVRTGLNEDLTGTRRRLREPHFSAFERGEKHFPGRSMTAVLEPEYDRLAALLVRFGNELTAKLRASAA
jgi:hypothetical protein